MTNTTENAKRMIEEWLNKNPAAAVLWSCLDERLQKLEAVEKTIKVGECKSGNCEHYAHSATTLPPEKEV